MDAAAAAVPDRRTPLATAAPPRPAPPAARRPSPAGPAPPAQPATRTSRRVRHGPAARRGGEGTRRRLLFPFLAVPPSSPLRRKLFDQNDLAELARCAPVMLRGFRDLPV